MQNSAKIVQIVLFETNVANNAFHTFWCYQYFVVKGKRRTPIFSCCKY